MPPPESQTRPPRINTPIPQNPNNINARIRSVRQHSVPRLPLQPPRRLPLHRRQQALLDGCGYDGRPEVVPGLGGGGEVGAGVEAGEGVQQVVLCAMMVDGVVDGWLMGWFMMGRGG